MFPEAESRSGRPFELTNQAISLATNAVKNLVVSRDPEHSLTEEENSSVDMWIGIAVAAGFQKGKWLSDVSHARRETAGFSLDKPDGYPT